jgi:hypothetical protein
MSVEAVDEAAERRRRRILTAALSTVAAVVLVGGSVLAWYLTPPAMPTSAEEAMAVAKSPRFTRLSAEDKRPYHDVFREQFGLDPNLRRVWRDDPELRDAARDMRREMRDERLTAFMLADFEERQAMAQDRPERRPRGDGAGRGGPPDAASARERVSERIANGNPQMGAARGEMIRSRPERERGR